MVNTVNKQTVIDDTRNLIVKVDIVGDGSGEETATSVVDISTFLASPEHGTPTGCILLGLESTLEGFAALLLWDADTDVIAYTLGQTAIKECFERFGGIKNNSSTGKTGDIKITTVGLGANDQGTILLKLRKTYG